MSTRAVRDTKRSAAVLATSGLHWLLTGCDQILVLSNYTEIHVLVIWASVVVVQLSLHALFNAQLSPKVRAGEEFEMFRKSVT